METGADFQLTDECNIAQDADDLPQAPQICLRCQHFLGIREDYFVKGTAPLKSYHCHAFPIEIPREILSGETEHFINFHGDQNLQFRPKMDVILP